MSGTNHEARNYEERIIRDKKICGGEHVFKGTRVTLRTVLASLADGDSAEDILLIFPASSRKTFKLPLLLPPLPPKKTCPCLPCRAFDEDQGRRKPTLMSCGIVSIS